MHRNTLSPFFMRNLFVATACIFLLTGAVLKPQVFLFFLSRADSIRMGIMVILAFFSAIQLNIAFGHLSDGPGRPWYISLNGITAAALGAWVFISMFYFIDCATHYILDVPELFTHKADLLLLLGATLLFTFRLNWLSKRP
ncbi:MAG: hypothetical protein IH624_13945 [Phycisphaerae bacterium]|nr:hypothetical protein [Phycisphaerae bacterium]